MNLPFTIHGKSLVSCSQDASRHIRITEGMKHITTGTLSGCNVFREIHFERKEPKSVRWSKDILAGVKQSQCVIFFPKGSAEAYKTHPAFEGFKIVVE